MEPIEVSTTLVGMARLGVKDERLEKVVAARAVSQAREMSAQSVANT